MATTTTNYGFDIPQSTDLVKDGATAIATLGQDIDTAMNTALGTKKAGMVLLNTTSFSGVTSQSFNNVFSATYDTYRIVFNISSYLAGNPLRFRYRVSGTDNSTSNYQFQGPYLTLATTNATYTANGATAQSSAEIAAESPSDAIYDFCNPFSSTRKTFASGFYQQGDTLVRTNHILFNATTSFDGFSIYANSGTNNITGTVSVYGYNK